jgi:predicted ATPase/class 3 adenylate cyclase
MNCGQPVSRSTQVDAARLTQLTAAAPAPLAEKVRASAYLAGEQRIVTALFLDVVGSTRLKETLGEQGYSGILAEAFDRFYPLIYRYEGTLARVQEDTILAFFGAPVAHEDDPVRALYTAVDLLYASQDFAQELDRERKIPFSVRIGLSTGPLIITSVAQDLKYEYRPVGNLINLASRIQTLVPAGSIALAEETQTLVAPFVETKVFCMIQIEGQTDPVCVYQLIKMTAEPSRPRGLGSLESKMVGRESELRTLQHLTETAHAGLGRGILILGEPGIGKTRLVDEWLSTCFQVGDQSIYHWFRVRGQSYEQKSAYRLVVDLLYNMIGTPNCGVTEEARENLRRLVTGLFDQPDEVYPYLAHLISLPLEGADQERVNILDPAALQSQYLSSLSALLKALAEQKPVVLVVEDLHWADPSSAQILKQSLPLVTNTPLVLCLVTRPDRDTPGWELVMQAREILGDSLAEIQLRSLNENDSSKLLASLLSGLQLPTEMRRLILENSEGNPLFIEELIRMLIGQGVLVPHDGTWAVEQAMGELAIPATLQGLLMARTDRLPVEVRETLRVASVIGRVFQLNLLEKVIGGSLLRQMSLLETAGLIRVTQVRPALEYSFRHALVHEVIYGSLLPDDRSRLHLEVGEAMEALYPQQEQELAHRLATHFHLANEVQKAVKYYTLAGEIALASYANYEAENHFRNALLLCQQDPARAALLERLGEVLFNQGRYFAAIDTWRQAIGYFRLMEDRDTEARLYARSARAAWYAGDAPGGLVICEEGMDRLPDNLETAGVAALLHETARARYFNGKHEALEELCQRALAIAKKVGNVNIQADTLATYGLLDSLTPDEALAALEKAVELAENHNLLATAGRAHNNLGTILIRLKGNLRLARKHYWRAAEIQHRRGAYSEELFTRLSITDVSFNLGELDSVEEAMHALEALREKTPDQTLANFWLKIFEAELMTSRGEWSKALPLLRSYRQEALNKQDLINLGDIDYALGWTLLEMALWRELEDTDEALQIFTEAVDTFQRSMKPKVNLYCLLSMLHSFRNEADLARRFLDQARENAGAEPIPLDAAWILWAQAHLDTLLGRWLQVQRAYQEAIGLIIPVGLRWQWARMLKDWADSVILRGEPEDLQLAQNLLRQSEELFKQLKAPEYAHRVERSLQAITTESLAQAAAHQRVSKELALAGRIQESFLPGTPSLLAGWQLAATLKPAHLTSGDFYDFIPLPGNRLGILIGDVADKGMGAALFMTLSRTLIRTYARDLSDRPEEVFASVNRRMLEDSSVGLFVTAFYGVLDMERGVMNYVNAGHNPPLLLHAGRPDHLTSLTRTGIPLGVFTEATWGPVQLQIKPGDTLLLYTDGVTEAQNGDDEFFGEERLQDAFYAYGKDMAKTVHDIQEGLIEAITRFGGASPRLDDIALILLKRDPQP